MLMSERGLRSYVAVIVLVLEELLQPRHKRGAVRAGVALGRMDVGAAGSGVNEGIEQHTRRVALALGASER